MEDYDKFLTDLAGSKGIDAKIIKEKMTACGNPGMTNTTVSFGLLRSNSLC